jgi:hypothetical protein
VEILDFEGEIGLKHQEIAKKKKLFYDPMISYDGGFSWPLSYELIILQCGAPFSYKMVYKPH